MCDSSHSSLQAPLREAVEEPDDTPRFFETNEHLEYLVETLRRHRRLLGHEIHDGLAQLLTAAQLHLQTFEHMRLLDPPRTADDVASREQWERAMEMLRRAIVETRRLIQGLGPAALEEFGLDDALEDLVDEHSDAEHLSIELHRSRSLDHLPSAWETAVFRIVQESLYNVSRHSEARKASVRIDANGEKIVIEIADDGKGFDPFNIPKGHFGLQGIKTRAQLLGGVARIESAPGKGARVWVELPLPSDM